MTKMELIRKMRFDLESLLRASGASKETLKISVIEDHRNEIARDIGKDWESLAIFIGVPNVDVDDIKEEYREPLDRRLAMMRRWHELWGSEATYLKLIEGLRQIGRRDLIEFLLLNHWQLIKTDISDDNPVYEMILYAVIVIFWIKKFCHKQTRSVVVLVITFILLPMIYYIIIPLFDSDYHSAISTEHSQADKAIYHLQRIAADCPIQNCSFPESDLPIIHPLFMGRENDVHQVLHKLAKAHIVNINGAPGFGKSTLAIHIGYEIFKNGTSVRYVNVEDKVSSIVNQMHKSEDNIIISESRNETDVRQARTTSLMEASQSSLSYYYSVLRDQKLGGENFNLFEELQRWSETINCTSVLILDNCDDILVGMSRYEFLRLVNLLVTKSYFKLRIIVVSHEKLLYLDSFDSWTVRELNQSVSVQLLDKLAPAIDNKNLTTVADLVEGCPLALKVIGQLLHIHGVHLITKIEKEMIAILDKASVPEQRFRVIMNIAFNRLGFPGSFDESAGIAIVQKECLETYLKYSLLNEYSLAFNYRYKMHRLIKEYLQQKISINENITFITKFRKHFEALLLTHVTRQEIDESDAKKHTLSLELHNLHYLKELLLINIYLTSKELTVLIFLSDMKLIQPEQLHRYYAVYIQEVHEVCPLLSNLNLCGQVYTKVVKSLYKQCKCKTITAYVQNFFFSPCMEYFQCEVVHYLQHLYTSGVLHLSNDESSYIYLVINSHCEGWVTRSYSIIYKYFYVIVVGIAIIAGSTRFCLNAYIMWVLIGIICIIWFWAVLIEPTALIYELTVKSAHYRILRFLEFTSKSVCQCTISLVSVMLTTYTLSKLSMTNNFCSQIIYSILTLLSIFCFVFQFMPRNYCCQFIPLCV